MYSSFPHLAHFLKMLIFKEKKNQHLSRALKNGYYIHTSLGLDEEKRKHFSEKKHKKQEKNKKGMYETHYALYFRRRAWERERRGGKLSY